ncbi:PRA1 family protein 3-like [Poecilia latipinna]|uniref:PRA1 family protein n=1 Tax=Poecilia latipinna TaxID=48699 RepID=A0A3B3UHC9_9TELE|nr:PREDICTED: PRA1 family protein 3-like [Poecilia latipinna]
MPPFRQWGDFFPGWKTPANGTDFHDRLISNLLYYQTNYLVLSTAVYIIAGFKDPVGVGTGTAVMLAVFLLSACVGELPLIVGLKRRSPLTFLIIDIIAVHFVAKTFVGIRTFLSATAICLAVTVSHASLCNRNVNEVACIKEAQKLKGSPMGFLLKARGKEKEMNN